MGRPKSTLEWHGSTLLARVSGLLARTLAGPIVVVRAPHQALPPLPLDIEVTEDAREARGPLEGIAAGFRAVGSRATAAYVSSVDAPLLQPAFVRRVVALLEDGLDAAVPRVEGRVHPLAAAYRVSLLPVVEELLETGHPRARDLLDEIPARFLDEDDLLADREVRACDPALDSLRNLNTLADYEEARALPSPPVWVRHRPVPGAPAVELGIVHAATLGEAALAAGFDAEARPLSMLNGETIRFERELPLVAGDSVLFEDGES